MKLFLASFLIPAALGRPALLKRMSSVIPLFPPQLASSEGRKCSFSFSVREAPPPGELEPMEKEAKSFYEGSSTCYVSPHGQRSSACAKFPPHVAVEVNDDDKVARRHPLHI
mmetsp:Transcript_28789/g.92700  ORF Transcript_28789/g.92700 Transcript_28789/m.92700 type:complete len:112 (+) Transcript_28789:129-464(+)